MIERKLTGDPPGTTLPPGTVDTQLHVYLPGFPARPGGPELPENPPGLEDYQQLMNWLGIERFVITQGNAHQRDNANIIAALNEAGATARGVAIVDETTPDAEIETLAQAGVVGARIMNLPGGAVGLDQLEAVDARAADAGWMIAVQFDGSDIAAYIDRLARLRSRWVFDHHGKFFRGIALDGPELDMVKRLIDGGNCWFKFAGCYESSCMGGPDYPDIATIARHVANYAPERIVWGTNFPHNGATRTEDYPDDAALLDTVMDWFPNDTARHLALVENPQELYGFPAC